MFPITVLVAELILCGVAFWKFGVTNGCGALLLIALTLVFFYYAAKNKQQASFVKSGTIEFVVAGETLLDVLENIKDWHYQQGTGYFPKKIPTRDVTGRVVLNNDKTVQLGDGWECVTNGIVPDDTGPTGGENGPSGSSLFEKRLGFFWVSILYPLRKVFSFPVTHLRLKPETAIPKDAPLDQYLDSSIKDENGNLVPGDTTQEQFLLWKFPRPVLVRDVEFEDLYEANVLIQCTYQIVRPMPFVFEWRERFFPLLEQAVQAAAVDYMRAYPGGYEELIRSGVTGSQSPFFWEALDPLNFGNRGFIHEFGVYLRDARVMQIQVSDLDGRSKNALKAQKVAELEGEGLKATANAQAEAIKTVANANAEALRVQLSAAPNNPELIMGKLAVEIAQKRAEGNAAFAQGGGTTLVEGGGQAGIMITPTERKPPPPTSTP